MNGALYLLGRTCQDVVSISRGSAGAVECAGDRGGRSSGIFLEDFDSLHEGGAIFHLRANITALGLVEGAGGATISVVDGGTVCGDVGAQWRTQGATAAVVHLDISG